MRFIIINNYKFTKAEELILEALRKKIEIKVFNNNEKYKSDSAIILSYKNSDTTNKQINHLSELLYIYLNNIQSEYERLKVIKNLFNNEDIVIMSAGPYLNTEMIRYLVDNYITICVKYVANYLFEHDMRPTFIVYNQWLSDGVSIKDFCKYSKIVTSIYGKVRHSISQGTINFNLIPSAHKEIFSLIEKNNDVFIWKNNKLEYKACHIMLELSIPLAIHIGAKNIYTTGWDLDYTKSQYFTNKVKLPKNIQIRTEAHVVKNVVDILKKKKIYIFKLNDKSPIELPYYRLEYD
jgi:uncharacterized Rossmann fold enzyme